MKLVAVLAALGIAALAAGCGEGDGPAPGEAPFDPQINLADCNSWNDASTEERIATVEQIQNFTGGSVQGTGGRGAVLSDERAFDLFEATCSNDYARYFKLYKLYGRAAAFAGE